MSNLTKILVDGAVLSLFVTLWMLFTLWINPHIFLHDYPAKIQEIVPPKTRTERQLVYVFGVPLLLMLLLGLFLSTFSLKEQGDIKFLPLWLNAAGVLWVFNIVDWLILGWLIFCALTPRFIIIPGSEGMAEYKDYRFHFRGFLKGTTFSIIGGLIIAGIVYIV